MTPKVDQLTPLSTASRGDDGGVPTKERPILFSAPMVRAILDGRKTQLRRAIKGVPSWDHFGRDIMDWGLSGIHQFEDDLVNTDRWALDVQTEVDDHSRRVIRCPYGAPGDRLWVRERFSYETLDVDRNRFMEPWYWADGNPTSGDYSKPKPSIHMPRIYSRITLEITDVRVERLNAITEADATAEGTQEPSLVPIVGSAWSERDMYARLWEHINGAGFWAANPWVWAVSFKAAALGEPR